jgi:HK97 family phage portal protein
MATIQTLGAIATIQPNWMPGTVRSSVSLYDQYNYDYATLYRTQPNVRTCVDFLARNIAQLGLHVFRRVSDTDRERLRDHGLAQLLNQPLPPEFKMTRYRLIESLVSDLGIYFNAYWLKLKQDGQLRGLLRIPPIYMSVQGGLVPTGYEMAIGGKVWKFGPEEVVHFHGYNPENPIAGLSPLETLRRVLAEEHAAGKYREEFWQNSARMKGFVKRPADAPEWSDAARDRFIQEFNQLYAGFGKGGSTAVLEDGMEWQEASFSAQESEYLAGRKLTREECARAYHIPLPMVGILDHATFSNIKEQHKNLYQDSLGPWLSMIEQDIELQLLPDFADSAGVYVEFNIAEKLQGSFEEQTQALQAAVGRPWMTANEARARHNLPSLEGGDELVTPLNVLTGGQASPRDSAPKSKAKAIGATAPELRERHEQKWTEALTRHYRRQEAAIVSRVPKGRKTDIGGVWWDDERWDSELTADLFRLNNLTAMAWAGLIAEQTGMPASEERMQAWLLEHSQVQAGYINGQTRDALEEALRQPEPLDAVKNVFNLALTVWAVRQAVSAVTSASNFGATEAAIAGGLTKKTWRVNSSNPRPSHAALNGTSVGIRDKFPNGLRWPGDPAGTAEDNAMCHCTVDFE